jgi:hypothetical protein
MALRALAFAVVAVAIFDREQRIFAGATAESLWLETFDSSSVNYTSNTNATNILDGICFNCTMSLHFSFAGPAPTLSYVHFPWTRGGPQPFSFSVTSVAEPECVIGGMISVSASEHLHLSVCLSV